MTTQRLVRLLHSRTRPHFVLVAGLGLGQAAFSIALTLGVAKAFQWITTSDLDQQRLVWIATGALCLAAISLFFRYSEHFVGERLGQEYVHAVRMQLFRHLEALPARNIAGERKGATVLRFIGDLSALKTWVSRGLVGATIALLTLSGGVTALFILEPQLGAVALGALLFTGLIQAHCSERILKRVRTLRRQRSRLATDIVERVESLGVVQASNQTERERRRIARRSRGVVEASVRTARASGALLGIAEAASIGFTAMILITGSTQVATGRLDPSALVAALVLSRFLGSPIKRISRLQEQRLRAVVSRRKLEQFLALAGLTDPSSARGLKPGDGRLKIRNLDLDGVRRPINATAPAHSRIRLEGRSAIGKSTLLRRIAGLEEQAPGTISLDGRLLDRCSLTTVRSAICLVSPDLPLMRGSLRRNLTYGNPRASSAEIEAAISATDLETLIAASDHGLKTRITDGGSNLSSGEGFRVRLARALLSKPRVLLLDEADACLDRAGRRILRRVIRRFSGTVIFVWRGPGAPFSDQSWKLSQGRIKITTKPLDLEPDATRPQLLIQGRARQEHPVVISLGATA